MARFPYPCQEAMARQHEARGGSVAVRINQHGSRRVSIDGKAEVTMERAMRALERAAANVQPARA